MRTIRWLLAAALLGGCAMARTVGCVAADVAVALPFYALGYNGHGGVDGITGAPDVCGPAPGSDTRPAAPDGPASPWIKTFVDSLPAQEAKP